MPGLSDGLVVQGCCNEMQENGRAPAGTHRPVIKAPTSPDAGCGCPWRSLAPTVTWGEPAALGLQPPQGVGPLPQLGPEGGAWQWSPSLPLHRPAGIFPRAGPARSEEGSCGHFQGLLLLIPHGYRDHVVPEVAALGVQDGRLWLRALGGAPLGLLSATRQRAELPVGQVEAVS